MSAHHDSARNTTASNGKSVELPAAAKFCRIGLRITFGLLLVGNIVVRVGRRHLGWEPDLIEDGIWVALLLTWTPGILAILTGVYVVARYPDLSQRKESESEFAKISGVTRWVAGLTCSGLGLLFAFVLLGDDSPKQQAIGALFVLYSLLLAFLFLRYSQRRHVVLATLFDTLPLVGFLLFPIMIPSLVVGHLRLGNEQRS